MRVVVNGVEANPGRPVQNWGDLLALLDKQCADRVEMVIGVAFDGVALPSFRDPALDDKAVASALVTVDTAPQSDVLLAAVDAALDTAGPLRYSAVAVAEHFRACDADRGNRGLAEFADDLGGWLALAGTVTALADLDVDWSANAFGALQTHVDSLARARDCADWLTVADLLEHDVTGALGEWTTLLSSVQHKLQGPVPA
jgi:hypothetical protein